MLFNARNRVGTLPSVIRSAIAPATRHMMIIEVDTAHRLLDGVPVGLFKERCARRKSLPEIDHTASALQDGLTISNSGQHFPSSAPRRRMARSHRRRLRYL